MRYTVVAKMNDDMLEKPRGRPPRGFRDGGANSFEICMIFVWLQFSRVTAGLHISIDLLYHGADSLIAFWGARRRLQAWHGEQGRHRRQFDRWLPPGSSPLAELCGVKTGLWPAQDFCQKRDYTRA
jgi:hypothetical protein